MIGQKGEVAADRDIDVAGPDMAAGILDHRGEDTGRLATRLEPRRHFVDRGLDLGMGRISKIYIATSAA